MSDKVEKTDLQVLLEQQECIHCHNPIYSKYLERDIDEYLRTSRKIEKPSYLELTTITEGRIHFKDFDGYIDVCGLSNSARTKLSKANISTLQDQIQSVEQTQEAMNQAFRDCVLEIKGFKLERNSKSKKFKRGEDVPLPSSLDNHDFEEMINCVPPMLIERVWVSAAYLRNAPNEEEAKN